MKIVVVTAAGSPWRNEAHAALSKWWKRPNTIELHRVDDEDIYGYGRILSQYWKAGQDFAVVEPDIVVRPDVVCDFLYCKHEYCCYPYAWTTNVGPALGCTWFRSDFLKRYPDAMSEVLRRHVSWRQVDVVLMRHILARQYGEQPHVHLPPVKHLNERKQLLPEADSTPLMEVPLW